MVRLSAPRPSCPECHRQMTWVPGPEPEPGAHWMCPDGAQWRQVGGQLLHLETARALGE